MANLSKICSVQGKKKNITHRRRNQSQRQSQRQTNWPMFGLVLVFSKAVAVIVLLIALQLSIYGLNLYTKQSVWCARVCVFYGLFCHRNVVGENIFGNVNGICKGLVGKQ